MLPSLANRAVAVLLLSTLAAPALAQPAPPSAPPVEPPAAPAASAAPSAPPADTAPPAEGAPPSEETKKEARAHFNKGLALLQEEAWAAALAEFLVSRELFPTRVATNNAALALRKLQRFDESLDMYETYLRDFSNIPPGERTLAQRAVAELRDLVGTVEITGAEPGASIVVSSQDRGEYPPVKPLRVSAGTHLVRIFKEGFEPFETRVDVAGGQTAKVTAKLRVLKDSGRLKVAERGGRAIDVVVDNVVVGKTPWEGLLAVGNHTVALRGEGKVGTQPATAPVKSQQLTALTLVAEDLEAALRVEPTPAGASVAIDGVTVGRGIWLGRLRTGAHQVEVTADGFLPLAKKVTIERGAREIVKAELARDPNALMWRKPSKIFFEFSAGFTLVPTFGGDVAGLCTDKCSRPVGIGALALAHGGYELGSGFGFGLTAGYIIASQNVTGRKTRLTPNSKNNDPPPQQGTADDRLRLSAFVGGAHASYHLGETVPVLLRVGAGVLLGQVRDERSGRFTTRAGKPYKAYPVVDFPSTTYFYIDPEVRVGVRFARHFELSAGVQALMLLALSQPRWSDTIEIAASTDGIGKYDPNPVMGGFVLAVTPTVGLRYDF